MNEGVHLVREGRKICVAEGVTHTVYDCGVLNGSGETYLAPTQRSAHCGRQLKGVSSFNHHKDALSKVPLSTLYK